MPQRSKKSLTLIFSCPLRPSSLSHPLYISQWMALLAIITITFQHHYHRTHRPSEGKGAKKLPSLSKFCWTIWNEAIPTLCERRKRYVRKINVVRFFAHSDPRVSFKCTFLDSIIHHCTHFTNKQNRSLPTASRRIAVVTAVTMTIWRLSFNSRRVPLWESGIGPVSSSSSCTPDKHHANETEQELHHQLVHQYRIQQHQQQHLLN